MRLLKAIAMAALLAGACAAQAHGDADPAHKAAMAPAEQKPWGIVGKPHEVIRTIRVSMTDNMRFTPGKIELREGETVRFEVRNGGKVLHEFVLGTKEELDAHAQMMAKYPGMEHDEAHMAHVKAGKSRPLVWNFNRPGEFQFACLIPGHYEAGMVGTILVLPAPNQGNKS